MRNDYVKKLVILGMLSALSILLVYMVHFPIFPTARFLEYDMADVPILIGTFLYGPMSGLLLTGVVSVLQWLLISVDSGWIGALMHFCATGIFVLLAGNIYRRVRTRKGALMGLLVGAAAMVLAMIPLNLIFTVQFMGQPRETVEAMLGPIIIPFNAFKAVVNAGITFILYKPIAHILRLDWKKEESKSFV